MMIRSAVISALILGESLAIMNSRAVVFDEVMTHSVADAGEILSPNSPVGITPAAMLNDDDDHGMWGGWGNWGWWLFMPIMLLFWGGVIWLITWLVRGGPAGGRSQGDAVEVLRQRYDCGEISRRGVRADPAKPQG